MQNLYLGQVNYQYGKNTFLPYSVGRIWSYAKEVEGLAKEFDLKEIWFLRESISDLVSRMEDPGVIGLSCYIWNWYYNLELARAISTKFTDCLIVLGGPEVPDKSENFFHSYPFVDVLVHGEGELTFAAILKEYRQSPDLSVIPNISLRLDDNSCLRTGNAGRIKDLDKLPSPYLTGVFDDILSRPYDFHASQETVRGCPYSCLSGDTLINTVYGKIPIEKLAKQYDSVGVFTYDQKEGRAKVSTADNIVRTGTDRKLVRVTFTDDTHIDCTPDHRFLSFKWGNQHVEGREWEEEAKDLQSGQRVRAIREENVVKSVTPIPGKHDVYCMRVADTGWFYANGVLVHNCSFCDWGSATFQKVNKFVKDHVAEEIDWFGKHKIELLYNCDANYGMLKEDLDHTKVLISTKQKYGYPQKFRAAYAKKHTDNVLNVAQMLNDAGMSKGATISLQSLNDTVLDVIKRKNIVIDDLHKLIDQYVVRGIPTYSELILGLPGETYDSFSDGIIKLIDAGQHEGINVYPCIILKNSEMGKPEYIKEYGIKTKRMPMLLLHGSPGQDNVTEWYDLVVSTNTMSHEDWRKSYIFSWAVQSFHCVGSLRIIAQGVNKAMGVSYRTFYEKLLAYAELYSKSILHEQFLGVNAILDRVLGGGTWDTVLSKFGDVTWPPEEASFLQCISNKNIFYEDVQNFLEHSFGLNGSLALDLLRYQSNVIKSPTVENEVFKCSIDIKKLISTGELQAKVYDYKIIDPVEYEDPVEYAKQVVWYGRKGGTAFYNVEVK